MNDDVQLIRTSGVTQLRRREAWGRIVRAWHESGVSADAFARQHGVRAKALFRWQAKLRPQIPAAAGFDEVHCPPASDSAALELHAGDLRVLVHNHCHADLLRNLIHTLQERPC